ncbi:response regulator transcription factor [Streptacidiphilus sp. EB103A]|uniref:response regulator transcription factor n=1 Tax=Streptacidiphilus sp. EB103A TaxID=3156275 RepID=UPI0035170328
MPRVLVVEDDPAISSMLTLALRFLDYTVIEAATGREALHAARRSPDVILLDVGLPDFDGFEVCRRLRAAGIRVPVLFLTAKNSVEDKVHALTLGGDDYVTKPFDLNEVAARIRALLRRCGEPRAESARSLRVGWVVLDLDTLEVTRHGRPVRLSATELALLRYLLDNAGRVVPRAAILKSVWNHDSQSESGVVETCIYSLRRKLGDIDQSLIRTVRGAGYLVRESPPEDLGL